LTLLRVETGDLLAELRRLEAGLKGLLSREGDPSEMEVWRVYAGTEKVIAKLKARLGFETPGASFELPKAPSDPRRLLEDAKAKLSDGAAALSRGEHAEAVGLLRGARNLLRGYLTERRRAATRALRKSPKPS